MAKTVQLMFDGEPHDCLVVEENGETVCYRKDRRAIKFPAGIDLAAAVAEHNAANAVKPVTAEAANAQAAELAGWFDDADPE